MAKINRDEPRYRGGQEMDRRGCRGQHFILDRLTYRTFGFSWDVRPVAAEIKRLNREWMRGK
jgi:hypothetical protein